MEAIYETVSGRKIHKYDYSEGYVQWCAICGDGDDGHKMPAYDHPFIREPETDPLDCVGCGGRVDRDLHYGVYITRVSYATYCSRECAWKHDESKWEAFT